MTSTILAVAILAIFGAGPEHARKEVQFIHPKIKGHGKVVPLPKAAEQPKEGSKILVDLTQSGPSRQVNPGVEKVARFINIYAGAGEKTAFALITVVLHGDAVAAALKDDVYRVKFKEPGNPNLQLIRELKKNGVKFFVCGQALAHKGIRPDQVAEEVTVAVSALTVSVNHQRNGYAYVPLH